MYRYFSRETKAPAQNNNYVNTQCLTTLKFDITKRASHPLKGMLNTNYSSALYSAIVYDIKTATYQKQQGTLLTTGYQDETSDAIFSRGSGTLS